MYHYGSTNVWWIALLVLMLLAMTMIITLTNAAIDYNDNNNMRYLVFPSPDVNHRARYHLRDSQYSAWLDMQMSTYRYDNGVRGRFRRNAVPRMYFKWTTGLGHGRSISVEVRLLARTFKHHYETRLHIDNNDDFFAADMKSRDLWMCEFKITRVTAARFRGTRSMRRWKRYPFYIRPLDRTKKIKFITSRAEAALANNAFEKRQAVWTLYSPILSTEDVPHALRTVDQRYYFNEVDYVYNAAALPAAGAMPGIVLFDPRDVLAHVAPQDRYTARAFLPGSALFDIGVHLRSYKRQSFTSSNAAQTALTIPRVRYADLPLILRPFVKSSFDYITRAEPRRRNTWTVAGAPVAYGGACPRSYTKLTDALHNELFVSGLEHGQADCFPLIMGVIRAQRIEYVLVEKDVDGFMEVFNDRLNAPALLTDMKYIMSMLVDDHERPRVEDRRYPHVKELVLADIPYTHAFYDFTMLGSPRIPGLFSGTRSRKLFYTLHLQVRDFVMLNTANGVALDGYVANGNAPVKIFMEVGARHWKRRNDMDVLGTHTAYTGMHQILTAPHATLLPAPFQFFVGDATKFKLDSAWIDAAIARPHRAAHGAMLADIRGRGRGVGVVRRRRLRPRTTTSRESGRLISMTNSTSATVGDLWDYNNAEDAAVWNGNST